MSVYTGSCLFGAVTYEAEGEPLRVFEGAVRQTSQSISIHLMGMSMRSIKNAIRLERRHGLV